MPVPVQCDICGKLFSSRHVSSHKRLAHARQKPALNGEQDRMGTILELFRSLSSENKERLLARLVTSDETLREDSGV